MHDASAWLSLHLFHPQAEAHDRLLLEVVAPAVRALEAEGWLERFFFLRYGQGGPHVRLRLRGSREGWREAARGEVRRRWEAFGGEASSLQELAYEPEYERYGGPEAMGLAEELFHVSSVCALAVLPPLLQAPAKRLGLALELTFLGAQPIAPLARTLRGSLAYYAGFLGLLRGQDEASRHEARALFEKHGESLGARLSSLSRDWREGRLGGVHRRWTQALGEAFTALEALERDGRLRASRVREAGLVPQGVESFPTLTVIGMSQLHMLNNRLGVTLRMEAVLAYLFQHLLEHGRVEP